MESLDDRAAATDAPTMPQPPRLASVMNGVVVALVVSAIAVAHLWIISTGWMWPSQWPLQESHYYDLLCDGFLHGRTSLMVAPNPRILALADPYDPHANIRFGRLHDAVLFRGKYYLYWGPVPAVLLMPFKAWLAHRGERGEISDAYLLFAFTEGLVVVTALLLLSIRSRFFPDSSRLTLWLVLLAAGLGMPLPFLLSRPAVYETAIVAGQFFLLAALYLILTAFPGAGTSRKLRVLRLACAGACLALAVASRLSLAIAVVALAGLVGVRLLWHVPPPAASRARRWVGLGAFAAPLLAGAVSLGIYNHVRFGSWSESGQQYQLAGVHIRKVAPYLFSVRNVPPNVYIYAFRMWRQYGGFPWLHAVRNEGWLPYFVKVPTFYASEEVTGIVWTSPLLLLTIVPLRPIVRRLRDRARRRPPRLLGDHDGRALDRDWFVASALLSAALGFGPDVFFIGSTMRYFADLTPSLYVLAAIGAWQLEQGFADHPRRHRLRWTVPAWCAAAVVYGCLVGTQLAFTAADFRTHNRPLFDRLARSIGGAR